MVCQYSNQHLAGTNYQTKDHSRREVVDNKGNIQGQYSYVDPSGSTINVKYLAGKDGFKILNEPNHQQQLVAQTQTQHYQVPVSYQSQKSGKPLRQRQPQPQLFKQHQQQQVYQEPLHQQVYQQTQQAYQKPQAQQTYQRPSFQSYQDPQIELQGFKQAFQQNQNYQHQYQPKIDQAFSIPQNLFRPAEHPYPAYTAGQVKNMRKFFEDEQADMEKMEREAKSSSKDSSGQSGQAYVSVKNTNDGYIYDINL